MRGSWPTSQTTFRSPPVPFYDLRCDSCGHEQEEFCAVKDRNTHQCPACHDMMRVLITPVDIVGPTWSKPIVYDQVGMTFDSQKAADAYTAETGNRPASAEEWTVMKDAARERAEACAKRLGFNDLEHRNAVAEKAPAQHFIGD
jgi:putative FmdB family regulatory protein